MTIGQFLRMKLQLKKPTSVSNDGDVGSLLTVFLLHVTRIVETPAVRTTHRIVACLSALRTDALTCTCSVPEVSYLKTGEFWNFLTLSLLYS